MRPRVGAHLAACIEYNCIYYVYIIYLLYIRLFKTYSTEDLYSVLNV